MNRRFTLMFLMLFFVLGCFGQYPNSNNSNRDYYDWSDGIKYDNNNKNTNAKKPNYVDWSDGIKYNNNNKNTNERKPNYVDWSEGTNRSSVSNYGVPNTSYYNDNDGRSRAQIQMDLDKAREFLVELEKAKESSDSFAIRLSYAKMISDKKKWIRELEVELSKAKQ